MKSQKGLFMFLKSSKEREWTCLLLPKPSSLCLPSCLKSWLTEAFGRESRNPPCSKYSEGYFYPSLQAVTSRCALTVCLWYQLLQISCENIWKYSFCTVGLYKEKSQSEESNGLINFSNEPPDVTRDQIKVAKKPLTFY